MKSLVSILVLLSTLFLSGCGYNSIQTQDENVKAAWSDILIQYQRRNSLTQNMVEVVQKYASHEKETLTGVIEARSKAVSLNISEETLKDPAAMKRFNAASGELSGVLSRLMMVTESYPDLKADARFKELMASLEGTENRIATAQGDYTKAVRDYNNLIRSFPTNLTAMMFDYDPKSQFTVENEAQISQAPKVTFK